MDKEWHRGSEGKVVQQEVGEEQWRQEVGKRQGTMMWREEDGDVFKKQDGLCSHGQAWPCLQTGRTDQEGQEFRSSRERATRVRGSLGTLEMCPWAAFHSGHGQWQERCQIPLGTLTMTEEEL